jgi:tetratricopeptide (TPR) repeat protein
MRVRMMTATRALEEAAAIAPGTGVPSARLLRPFLDLSGGAGPINAQVVQYTATGLPDPEDIQRGWLPPQGNTRASLRASLIRETGLASYAVTTPADLPAGLRSPAWQELCDTLSAWPALGPAARYHVVCALYKLGLFQAAVACCDLPDTERIAANEHAALLAVRLVSARSKIGRPLAELSPLMVSIARTAPSGGRGRLAAVVNLAIHYGRTSRDRAAIATWCDQVRTELAQLRPGDRPADLIAASAALRAASFGPFAHGDRAGTLSTLDEADGYAEAAEASPTVPEALTRENRYALLETRANVAVWLGDREEALRHAEALVRHDPLEPRARLQLGAVHFDDARLDEALASYEAAAALGAPFTATAWYCVARCHEAAGRLDEARHAYTASVTAEPHGLVALLGAHRTAIATGRPDLAGWAASRLGELHSRHRPPVR